VRAAASCSPCAGPSSTSKRGVARIEAALSQTKSGVIVKGTKTDRVRTVPLSAFALDALRRRKASQAADKLAAGAPYQDAGFVFADARGRCITPCAATYAFAQLARQAGISSTRLHDARHTAATTMLVAGVDARSVAGMLGHRSAHHDDGLRLSSRGTNG
jgi:integrase